MNATKRWSGTVGFKEIRGGTKRLDDIYIQLDTYLTPIRLHQDSSERAQSLPLEEAIFRTPQHCIVLGQPGAGKTTSMQRICGNIFSEAKKGSKLSEYNFPIFLKFRDLAEGAEKRLVIFDALIQIFPLQFRFSGPLDQEVGSKAAQDYQNQAFLKFIDALAPVLILEGFDEYPDSSAKQYLAQEVKFIVENLVHSKVIVTCRSGEFNYHFQNCGTFEIADLNRAQIEAFVRRWIHEERDAVKFIDALYKSPFSDTAIKPLSLAHLCAIYERIGRIPDQPQTVYSKVVHLLLEDWDHERFVRRKSRYAQFEPDRKFDFLSSLAYYLTTRKRRSTFSKLDFMEAYKHIGPNFNLPPTEATLVALEVESHTGLFLQAGYDRFEFAHKSIQEYLTAVYIVKLPSIPNEPEVIKDLGAELAIAVAISSDSSMYMADLVLNVLSKVDLSDAFYDAFINRVILEKPVFSSHKSIVVAFFALLSFWVNNGKSPLRSASYRAISEEEEQRYRQLMGAILAHNSLDMIGSFYDHGRALAVTTDLFQVSLKSGTGLSLPPMILIPKSLMRECLPIWRRAV